MSDAAIDIADLRGWIGREETREDVYDLDLARKYHATFDFPGDPPETGDAAPPLLHFCLAQPSAPTAALGPDGHPARGGFLPPAPLPRRMWAGGEVTLHAPLRVGDRVRRVSRIEDVTLKQGRAGALVFVAVRHRLEANGRLCVDERQDVVYRGPEAPGGAPMTPPPAPAGERVRAMTARAPLLFRYSALTFNGHRIHYDRRYVIEDEGYPGLVVHGPLQAALLANYASELRGAAPTRFSYRGLAPLFDDDSFTLNASPGGDGLKLWTARAGGPVCMSAAASWV